MKRSITRWTTALAAAACLATPTLGWSQTPPASQTPATQQQPSTAPQPSAKAGQPSSQASEHIRQAQAALGDIPATVPARAKSRIAEVKRHLSNLEKSADSSQAQPGASAQGSKTTARGKSNWSTEVAAIDKILTELLGSPSTSGATEPTGTTGAAGSKARSTTTVTLDEPTKSKLMEVRTHVTAFAAAMSGTSGAAADPPSPSEPAAADPAAAAAQPQPSEPATQQPTTQPAGQPPTTQPTQSAGQPPATQNPTGAEQPQQPTAPSGQQVDAEASKRHLTAARESLSQLTQLPAAAQLSGEPRTQVSQLITNFNELITTKENWRESYDKVAANLSALLGPETSEQPQPQSAPTPGAVGTSGTMSTSIDPAIRAKLVEFRTHLKQFEQAAGSGASQETASAGNQPAASPSPSSTPAATQPPAATTSATSPTPTEPRPASAMGQDSAVQHIDAIEAILSGRSGATTGNAPAATAGATTGNITLTQSQVEEIRMHLTELRKVVKK